MPYKIIGKTIYTKKSGKWKKKQTAKSVMNAKKTMRLLRGIESRSIKKSQVGRGKFAKKRTRKKRK